MVMALSLLPRIVRFALVGLLVSSLSACIHADTKFTAARSNRDVSHVNNVSDEQINRIILTEGVIQNRAYTAIGTLKTLVHSNYSLTADPTRSDVDLALRTEAAKYGADAVIKIKYDVMGDEFQRRHTLYGEGIAVKFQ